MQRRHQLGCPHAHLHLGPACGRAAVLEQRHLRRRLRQLLAAEQRPERHAACGDHARRTRRAAREQLELQLQRRRPVARAPWRAAEGCAALAEGEGPREAEVELGAMHHQAQAAHRRQVERGGQQRDGDLNGLAAQLAEGVAAELEAAGTQLDAHRGKVGIVRLDQLARRPEPASAASP
eukprot:scaffold70575_cov69-Phaeocystis_antarctica.AAC.4